MLSRRKVLKMLAGIPLIGTAVGSDAFGAGKGREKKIKTPNLFDDLGVEPLINARGTMTYLSGSLMLPEVVDAIRSTSHEFANLNEVQDKVGARIAKLLHCEAAMVTSGAAGALTIGTAATITGTNEEKINQLPNLPGPRREVIIQKSHRYVFDQAVRSTGVKFVEVEGSRQMEEAINERTVMGLFFNAAPSWFGTENSISHEEFVAIGKRYGIPTFIDAAADVPPVENLFKYQKMGFDLVTFSGGKMIRGPQSAGLLLGRKNLIEAAKLNFDPYECPIGRPMKVNKEEIFGMYVALKAFIERDHEQEWQEWIERIKHITARAETVPTVRGTTHIPQGPANHFPGLRISWDQSRVKITPEKVEEKLRKGNPRIETSGGSDALGISVVTLKPEQVEVVARRVREVLEQAA